jgi:hypothetical protein
VTVVDSREGDLDDGQGPQEMLIDR